jgi:hypothetical protein
MERAEARTWAKHFRWTREADGLVWLTFDKQASRPTPSRAKR